ncbi:MAG TPA: 16S rRNA (guanine(527)-N(7))-methyltransferase RsmG [Coxiellaceae bacterium]|nr:16S rRNA (guanine(527)-N(7))-methyltransferase RsmG [Coxiellaceae bacterium]
MPDLKTRLSKGIHALGLIVPVEAQEKMLQFLTLVQKWNRVHNLTAITDLQEMVTKHLLDSLAILPFVQGKRILDIGTGAGFPGVPLALALPNKTFTLLDSAGKKICFLRLAKEELALSNIKVEENRVELFHDDVGFDTMVCRAVGSMEKVLEQSRHLAHPQTRWLFMKGQVTQEELQSVNQSVKVHSLKPPELNEQRTVVVVEGEMRG